MRPTFDFYLDLGILRIHTAIWNDSLNSDARDFVAIFFEVWRTKIFHFRLYETGMSRRIRESEKRERLHC